MFLFDRDFAIDRPKRYYRKLDPFQLVDGSDSSGESDPGSDDENATEQMPDPNATVGPHKGTLSRLSVKLHLKRRHSHSGSSHLGKENGHATSKFFGAIMTFWLLISSRP